MAPRTKKVIVTAGRKARGRNAPSQKKRAKHHKSRVIFTELSYAVEPPPWEREDWKLRKNEILAAAQEVVDLYQQLGAILGDAAKSDKGYGHNRGPEFLEVRAFVLADESKTKNGIKELETELGLASPRKGVLRRFLHMFGSLRGGAEAVAKQLKDKVIEQAAKGSTDAIAAAVASSLASGLRYLSDLISRLL